LGDDKILIQRKGGGGIRKYELHNNVKDLNDTSIK
jgi:hypothetical protein